MHMLERLADLIAPDDCLLCGRESRLLCADCLPQLPAIPGRCFGCAKATEGAACPGCISQANLDSVQTASHYTGIAKLLVANLKFRGNQSAARLMAEAILLRCTLPADGLLVHMPATTSHVRERGYDQSALMVRHISRLTGLHRADLLRRSGSHHQLGADRQQRLEQLSDALSVSRAPAVQGKHIMLIDDVLTTGSSLSAAASALRRAGAARIDAVTFAQSIA